MSPEKFSGLLRNARLETTVGVLMASLSERDKQDELLLFVESSKFSLLPREQTFSLEVRMI